MVICFLDNNIFITAIHERTAESLEVIERFHEDENFQPIVSALLIEEVLLRLRFLGRRKTLGLARKFIQNIPRLRIVEPSEYEHLLSTFASKVKDPDDLPHICAATVAQCRWFITLNRRLARETEEVAFELVTPEEWLARV